jgi:hypothetical protein
MMPIRFLLAASALVLCSRCVAVEPLETVNQGSPLPIWAWVGVPSNESTPQRYRELADAGFTLSYSGAPDPDAMTKMLDAAEQAGVKLLVGLPELQTDPEGTARQFQHHPAIGGYFLVDEPGAASFPDLGKWTERIQAVDPVHPCYINLLPTYGPTGWGTPDYLTYIDRYLAAVPTPMLSFDNYPIHRTGDDPATDRVRDDYYQNLELCSSAARKANRPLYAFILSVAHTPYPIPTLAHLRLQAYSDLAYGAQVLQYFTYWTPTSTVWNFHEAPIAADGSRTATYDLVKQFNAELQAVRGVFAGSQLESVGHTGDAIPVGTTPFKPAGPITSLVTTGEGVAASVLSRDNRRFLVLVNRDIHRDTQAKLQFDGSAAMQSVAPDGSLHPIEGTKFDAVIAPGNASILSWENKTRPAG